MERYLKGVVTVFMLLMFTFVTACSSNSSTETTTTTEVNETSTTTTTTEMTETSTTVTTANNTTITTSSTEENTQTTTTRDNNSSTTTTEQSGVTTTYVFEAEYTYLDDMIGTGYSGGTYGTGVIVEDTKSGDASNGYYVSYLYSLGTTLSFEIESDRAVDNAYLVLRLSAELIDFTLTSDMYTVMVNGMGYDYEDMVFENVPGMQSSTILPFADFVIGNIELQEGINTIDLVTTNSQAMGGTMYSTAPMIDCLKITTVAELTWNAYTDNIQ
ncbi:MAG: hypothetical protein RBR50_02290 [Candidatus Izemoplasmatales bacterium]|nr:hypothetical protein [Candidatus Izemoplasmatales bacterium]